MLVDFDQVVKDLDGNFVSDGNNMGQSVPLTLARACSNALVYAKGQKMSGSEYLKQFDLGLKIHKGGKIDVSENEIALLKQVIPQMYPVPLVVAQTYKMLESQTDGK